MRNITTLLLIYLVLSLNFILAENQSVMAIESSDKEAYNDFWKILNTEAGLIVELNATKDKTQLGVLAHELISNSQNGSRNAAQISALIWQSLDDIEKAGIKTYFTAEELRQMAENISKNGLPPETVQTLKEQGWSDDEIKALQYYIAENADQIDEDFNLTEFLEDFSQAFINVAFKYNHYEAWALEKWLWNDPQALMLPQGQNEVLPQVQREWINFYEAYHQGSLEEKLNAIEALKQREYSLITGEGIKVEGGFLILTQTHENPGSGTSASKVDRKWKPIPVKPPADKCKLKVSYYWEALKSYELTSQIESILTAQKLGNKDPELNLIMNEKISELKKALMAVKTITSEEGCPIIEPPKPTPGILSQSEAIPQEALMDMHEGHLVVNVSVIAADISKDYVTYRLKVSLEAKDNAVRDVRVSVDGIKLSDSTYYDYIDSGNMKTWTSDTSGRVYDDDNDGKITVSGKVKLVYTPSCGEAPASLGFTPMSCSQPREILVDYSKTIELEQKVDPNRVHFYIIPSSTTVNVEDSVTFKVKVVNDNNLQISGGYNVNIAIPEGHGQIYIKKYSDLLEIPAHSSKIVTVATINYGEPGTFEYSGSFNFDYYSKDDSGSVTVNRHSPPSGSIYIYSVSAPEEVNLGDTVNFSVRVDNTYSQSKSVVVYLYVDGAQEDFEGGDVEAGGSRIFALQWMVPEDILPGDYDYLIRVIHDGQVVDETAGTITITTNKTQGVEIVSLECPSELEIPGELWCKVVVRNSNSSMDITARVRMDRELIDLSRTLGNTNPTLNEGENEFCIGININDDLAQNEFDYNSFLDFLDSRVITKENCGHGVSDCQIFEGLPTPHSFNIEIYKNNKLLNSKETTVTLIYGDYYEKKFLEYYALPLASAISAGTATAFVEGANAGIAAAKVGALIEVINIVYDFFKKALR